MISDMRLLFIIYVYSTPSAVRSDGRPQSTIVPPKPVRYSCYYYYYIDMIITIMFAFVLLINTLCFLSLSLLSPLKPKINKIKVLSLSEESVVSALQRYLSLYLLNNDDK